MTQVQVAHDGAHRCYVTETGIDRDYLGCSHVNPRDAIAHSDELQRDGWYVPEPTTRAGLETNPQSSGAGRRAPALRSSPVLDPLSRTRDDVVPEPLTVTPAVGGLGTSDRLI